MIYLIYLRAKFLARYGARQIFNRDFVICTWAIFPAFLVTVKRDPAVSPNSERHRANARILCLITAVGWQRVKARMIAVNSHERRVIFTRLMDHGVSTSPAAPEYIPRLNIESAGNLSRNLFLDAEEGGGGGRTFKRHFRCKSGAPSPFFSLDREALSNLPSCAAVKFARRAHSYRQTRFSLSFSLFLFAFG